MSDALAIASSGLKSEEYYIAKIANDLANINTPNYKAAKIIFADLVFSENKGSTNHGLGTSIYKTTNDFSNGPLKPTNNWNDLAIDGSGFFQVIQTDGTVVFTRNSSLKIDEERYSRLTSKRLINLL